MNTRLIIEYVRVMGTIILVIGAVLPTVYLKSNERLLMEFQVLLRKKLDEFNDEVIPNLNSNHARIGSLERRASFCTNSSCDPRGAYTPLNREKSRPLSADGVEDIITNFLRWSRE